MIKQPPLRSFLYFLFGLLASTPCWAQQFTAVGEGLSDVPYGMAVDTTTGKVYVSGGFFTRDSYFSVWDGATWTKLHPGSYDTRNPLNAMTFYRGSLFGSADLIKGGSNCEIARWNGTDWDPELDIGFYSVVNRFRVYDDKLYAIGAFKDEPWDSGPLVKVYDGSTWTSLDTTEIPYLGAASDAVFFQGQLYVAGYLEFSDSWTGLGQWNGSSYEQVKGYTSLQSEVTCLAVYQNELYVASTSAIAGRAYHNSIVKWDGKKWHTISDGLAGYIYELIEQDGLLYAFGALARDFGEPIKGIMAWDGQEWCTLGFPSRTTNDVAAFVDGELFVGFRTKDYPYNYIAKTADYLDFRQCREPIQAPDSIPPLHFNLYPNPTTGPTTLVVPEYHEQVTVELYSTTGQILDRQVYERPPPEIPIDLSHLASGLYLLRVQADERQFFTRIQKTTQSTD